MRNLDREQLDRLQVAWREASDAVWQAQRALEQAEGDARTAAEEALRRAEHQVANVREALRLFGFGP